MDVGPCVSKEQRETVNDYVQIGLKEDKATLIAGGDYAKDGALAKGWFYKPTIFKDVTPDMRIAKEEIFGPVLAVLKCNSLDEAIEIWGQAVAIEVKTDDGAIEEEFHL